MCGKTLIKSLSVQFYLGDITCVKCRCGLCCLWDRRAHTCFADSKQFRKAFKSWWWVDGVGGSRWARVKPHRVWGSHCLMSSWSWLWGAGAGGGLGLGLGQGEFSWRRRGFWWGSRPGLLGVPGHHVHPQGTPQPSHSASRGAVSPVGGMSSPLPEQSSIRKDRPGLSLSSKRT